MIGKSACYRTWLLGSFFIFFLSTASAEASRWKCSYVGSWHNKISGKTGNFEWTVWWEKRSYGWKTYSTYTDGYGTSALKGRCVNKLCDFTQHYHSGSYRGKTFYWIGRYTDRWFGQYKTVNHFKGTYGYERRVRDDGGTWKAIATCHWSR